MVDRRMFLKQSSLLVAYAAGAKVLMACAEDPAAESVGEAANGGDGGEGATPSPSESVEMDTTTRVFQAPSRFTQLQAFILVAEAKGFFEEEGLTVALNPGTGTADAITQVASGGAFVGIADPLTLAPLIADDDAGLISIGEIADGVFWEVASSPDAPLNHPSDWQGKTVGIASAGGATEQFLDAASVVEGLDPANVTKPVTGLDAGSYAFLEQGEVDGFIAFYASKAALNLQPDVELNYTNLGEWVPVPSSSFMIAKSQLENEATREAARRWLRATRRGFLYAWDDANLEEVIDVLGEYTPDAVSDRDLARETFRVTKEYMAPRDDNAFFMDPERWDAAHELIFEAGFVEDTSVPMSEFYTNELIEEL